MEFSLTFFDESAVIYAMSKLSVEEVKREMLLDNNEFISLLDIEIDEVFISSRSYNSVVTRTL